MRIGEIIKRLRKDRKVTLRELSEKSNVALATLCRIEKGKMTGTVKSHGDIAKAFNLSLSELYSGFEIKLKKIEIQHHDSSADKFIHNDKASFDILTKNVLLKKMMPVLLKLEKGAVTSVEQAPKGSEKFLYVLEGKMQAVIGNIPYLLAKGDSFYFDASLPHYWKNSSKNTARVLCITTPTIL
ncbi:MAG: cupin domain-containing protein [Candidatus Omnitrophota bacterium]